MRGRLAAAGLALVLHAATALACGVCLEDRLAAVYDHGVPGRTAQRREILRSLDGIAGVDRGTVRVSLEHATVSFAFDPGRAPDAHRAALGAAPAGRDGDHADPAARDRRLDRAQARNVRQRRLGSRIVASVVAGLAVLATGVLAGPASRIAAHRGGAALAPENSLAAFRNAIALGADALEFDVHLTADGEPVVIHDAALERTTTGIGAVADTTLTQLRALRLKSRDGGATAEGVPTLTEVLELAAPAGVEVLPEIKTARGGRRYPGIEEKLLAQLEQRRFGDRATIQAFDETTIRRMHELAAAQRTMLLVSASRLKTAGAEPVQAVRWASEVGASDLGMDVRTIDAALVAAARAARIRLAAWTVNTEPDLRRMLDLGVDIVMSDHPDVALGLAGRATRKP